MGSKKKEKKKKRKREDDYYSDHKEHKRKYEKDVDDHRESYRDKNVALTEEYVYDHTGERIGGERDMSPSPEKKKKDITPPPPPPGMDWPFEASKSSRSSSQKDSDWSVNDDKARDRDYQDDVHRKWREKQKESKRKEETPVSSSKDESLSIEETNKLRVKLGLKPLQMDDKSSANEEKSYADRDDVHKPAVNISELKSADKMREKMEAIRDKRKINRKLQKVKGLGVADDEDPAIDSAASWVAKSRQLAKEKQLAEKRAQLLEEMDDEFGVSDLIAETARKIKKEPEYSSTDLKGLRVEHKGTSFAEGANTVLTLKDKNILDDDDDEDVLVNVNIIDNEKAKKNVLNKRKGPAYKAYDEEDEDSGGLKIRGLLDKYDEEIDGAKKSSFRIDGSGQANLEGENEMEKIRATLKAHQVSLEMSAPQLARDYFTEEEMVKFKKPRKKVKKVVRKRNVVKADDLLKLDIDNTADRGSRNKKSALKKNIKTQEEVGMDIVTNVPDELDYFVALNMMEENNDAMIIEEDEAEKELQLALERSRRSKNKPITIKTEDAIGEKIVNDVKNLPIESIKVEPESNAPKSSKRKRGPIVLDSTSEFCRTLGDLPTLGPPPPVVVKDELIQAQDDMEIEETDNAAKGGWEQVKMKENNGTEVDANDEVDEDVLEPEPLPTGMASTLTLANMKGYLKDGREKKRRFDPLNLPETKAEIDTEKLRDEEKNRYGGSRGYDRERYDPYAFKEKSGYKPEVKLEYVDSKGRNLNQKEAFRLLSHKFHGKGSGKLKTEKRAKKIIEQKKLQKMSSIDTPLNTSAMFKERQKQGQTPYLVLSGGGKNLLSSDGLKK